MSFASFVLAGGISNGSVDSHRTYDPRRLPCLPSRTMTVEAMMPDISTEALGRFLERRPMAATVSPTMPVIEQVMPDISTEASGWRPVASTVSAHMQCKSRHDQHSFDGALNSSFTPEKGSLCPSSVNSVDGQTKFAATEPRRAQFLRSMEVVDGIGERPAADRLCAVCAAEGTSSPLGTASFLGKFPGCKD